jgi:N-acyl-L-homoserine lactone synthetase
MLGAFFYPSRGMRSMTPLSRLLRQDASKEFQVCDYVFAETKDPAVLRHIFQQRHGVYVFERYIEPDVFPGGVFRDSFDDVSAHIAAFDAYGSIVGSSRVVPPTALGLPTQRLFRLPEIGLGCEVVGEVGRLAVNPPHRGHARVVVTGLIAGIYRALRSRGLSHFLAFMHPALVRMLNSLRIPVRPLCELPPGPDQRSARQVMNGYFGRGGVRPTLCSLDEMDRCLGLPPG